MHLHRPANLAHSLRSHEDPFESVGLQARHGVEVLGAHDVSIISEMRTRSPSYLTGSL